MALQQTTTLRKIAGLDKRLRIIQGGSSSSKTFSILMVLIDIAQRQSNLTISVMSESMPHLRLGAIKDFQIIMKASNNWSEANWSKVYNTYTFPTGTIIEFFSSEDAGKVHGPRRDILFINECNNVPFEVYRQASLRTRQIVFLDYNPVHEFYVHEKLIDRDDADFIKVTYKDNEALDKSIVAELESYQNDPNFWLVYGLGEVGKLEGLIFDNYELLDEMPESAELVRIGLDFGYSDGGGCVAIYKYEGGYIVRQIGNVKGMSNRAIANMIRNHFDLPSLRESDDYFFKRLETLIVADQAEPKSIDEIKAYGVNIIPGQKGTDSVVFGIQAVKQHKLYFVKTDVDLLKAIRNYKWKEDKQTGDSLQVPEHAFSHYPDALRYAITDIVGFTKIDTGAIKTLGQKSILDELMEKEDKEWGHGDNKSTFS